MESDNLKQVKAHMGPMGTEARLRFALEIAERHLLMCLKNGRPTPETNDATKLIRHVLRPAAPNSH